MWKGLENFIDRRVNAAIKKSQRNFLKEVHEKVQEQVTVHHGLTRKSDDSVIRDAVYRCTKSEEFIDSIIKRIKDKQLP
jgi:hypothetical protein